MRTVLTRLWDARRAVLFYAILLLLGWLFGKTLIDVAVPEMRPMNEPMIHKIVSIALIVFVVAAAIPFVPGAEIGFALLMIFGGQAAPVVYVAMVSALILSFSIARLIPPRLIVRWLSWLGLRRAAALARTLADLSPEERRRFLDDRMPAGWARRFVRNRYLLMAAIINLPGNSVLGGGGGIAFVAGLSGLYRVVPFVITVLIAVAPVPLFFLLAR